MNGLVIQISSKGSVSDGLACLNAKTWDLVTKNLELGT